jgi:hypothetical protein
LFARGVRKHVDAASRVDGFVAHLLPFCEVTYVDLRPSRSKCRVCASSRGRRATFEEADSEPQLPSRPGAPWAGRYGDRLIRRASPRRQRTGACWHRGHLLIGTPVGRERLCFDAHRVFDPATIVSAFGDLALTEFNLITDTGDMIHAGASFDDARTCTYGCGLFVFQRAVIS